MSNVTATIAGLFHPGVNTNLGADPDYHTYLSKQPVDLSSIKDAPSLTAALQNKQITPQQFTQRHSQLYPIGNTKTPFSATLGNALNKAAPIARGVEAKLPGGKNAVSAGEGVAAGISRAAEGIVTGTTSLPAMGAKIGDYLALKNNPKLNNAPVPFKPGITEPFSTAIQNVTNKINAPVNKLANATQEVANRSGKVGKAVYVPTQVAYNIATLGDAGLNGLGKVGAKVKTLTGKDEAVNSLINNTKLGTALNTAKSANTASDIGKSVIKEANTARIPVVGPTQTAGARQALGSTAIENADRTSIPVADKSTGAVTGKVTTQSDLQYIKASNQLSDQYEKDLAKVKTIQQPIAQQIVQRQLDQKYNALQQNLDDSYGKSSISFKGKPQKVVSNESTLPRSALDKTPVEPFNSTRIPVQEEKPATGAVNGSQEASTTTVAPPETTGVADTAKVNPSVGEEKVTGSSLSSESRAVQKGLVSDLGEKATYTGGSYKQEADKAVKLVDSNPEKAKDVAMGKTPGDNTIHEVAVRRAVENKALKEGDVDTLRQLANSPQHSATSEAAQRLGAEGHAADRNSPVQAIRDINAIRAKAVSKKLGGSVEKVTDKAVEDIQKTTAPTLKVSRQDWHSFIESIKC